MFAGATMGCDGDHHAAGSALREESADCRTCPNRERCHGRKPVVTSDTVMRLVRDTVIEVLRELETTGLKRSG